MTPNEVSTHAFFDELEKIKIAMDPHLQSVVDKTPALKSLYQQPMNAQTASQIKAHPAYQNWRQQRWGGKSTGQLYQQAAATGQFPKPLSMGKVSSLVGQEHTWGASRYNPYKNASKLFNVAGQTASALQNPQQKKPMTAGSVLSGIGRHLGRMRPPTT